MPLMSRSKKQRSDPGKQEQVGPWKAGKNPRLYGMFVLVLLQLSLSLSLLAGVFANYRQVSVGLEQPNTTKLQEGNEPKECLSLATGNNPAANREQPGPADKRKCLLQTQRSPYMDIVCKSVLGWPRFGRCIIPGCKTTTSYNPVARKYGDDWPPTGFTMIGNERLENFRAAIEEVNRNNIPGAIVEMGVWRGGAMIMAAAVQKEFKEAGGTLDRHLFLFDAFEEIPKASYGKSSDFLFNSQQDVVDAFESFDLNDSNIHYKKGLFQHTAQELQTDALLTQIAVLRVDGNFYDSYQDALYYGYEKVPVGGIIIFDDVMSHSPVMRAWKDFKQDQGLTEVLNRIDQHSAWFRNEIKVRVEMTKMKSPQDINKPK